LKKINEIKSEGRVKMEKTGEKESSNGRNWKLKSFLFELDEEEDNRDAYVWQFDEGRTEIKKKNSNLEQTNGEWSASEQTIATQTNLTMK
jgi:hypothetical protein